MTTIPPRDRALQSSADDASVVRSEERLQVGTRSVVRDRVRVRRRIVTEERSVQVQVRREELVVEHREVGQEGEAGVGDPGLDAGPVGLAAREPLVLLLREEIPEVILRARPYERVTLTVDTVAGQEQVSADLRHEVVETELPDARDLPGAGAHRSPHA